MSSIKLITILLLRKNILQNPIIKTNNKILTCSKSFTFSSIYDFKLCDSRFFSDKKPTDKCPDLKAKVDPKKVTPDPKPKVVDQKAKPDPKAKADPKGKTIAAKAKPNPKQEAKVAAKAQAAKSAAKKLPPPKPKPKKPEIDKKAAEKIAELQCQFQRDDGKPIFLKMGFRDMVLYRSTCGLAIVGAFGVLWFVKSLMFTK